MPPNILDFERILTFTAHVYKISVDRFSHNLHILTLESGTVEFNLAKQNACIDFCVSCPYLNHLRFT